MKAKYFSVLSALILILLLPACSLLGPALKNTAQSGPTSSAAIKNSTPEETVKNALDAMISLDFQTFNRYLDNSSTMETGILFKDNKLFGDHPDQVAKSIVSGFSYKIAGTKEQGSTAAVQVQITNKDLSGVLSSLAKAKSEGKTAEIIDGIQTKKQFDVSLPLKKDGTGWKIGMTKELANAITGGLLSDNLLDLFK
jgi:hypothetical protein